MNKHFGLQFSFEVYNQEYFIRRVDPVYTRFINTRINSVKFLEK